MGTDYLFIVEPEAMCGRKCFIQVACINDLVAEKPALNWAFVYTFVYSQPTNILYIACLYGYLNVSDI